jgi:hypothetical protein
MIRRMMMFARPINALLILVVAGALSACIIPPSRDDVDSMRSISSSETVIVGRVELVPALRKEELRMKALNSGMYENKMFLVLDDHNRPLEHELKYSDLEGRIEANLGETFFVRSSNKPFYIVGGAVFLTESDKAFFPGGVKINLQAGDRAVYIGTIQYHRDEFFNISKVVVVDDYERANAEFRKKMGSKLSLRKVLPVAAK